MSARAAITGTELFITLHAGSARQLGTAYWWVSQTRFFDRSVKAGKQGDVAANEELSLFHVADHANAAQWVDLALGRRDSSS